MPKASPYLEASLARWADRGTLIRRDAEMMFEGLDIKGDFLEGLRARILQHRKEDLSQLSQAHEETWGQWDMRLTRLEQWTGATTELHHSSTRSRAWHSTITWFDRAQALMGRYAAHLETKADALEQRLKNVIVRTKEWTDRLLLKEAEIRAYLQVEALKSTEPIITSTRRRYFLDSVYAEREKEGALAGDFKSLRAALNFVLDRLARTANGFSTKADRYPGQFEIRQNQVLEIWRPLQKRFSQIREATLHQALTFEEGRTRLRWIYDTIQKMREVQDPPRERLPLLNRLFKLDDH